MTYLPSPVDWVRAEVEHLERTGHGLDGRAVILLTTIGAQTGAVRKTPLMRVEHAGSYAAVASMGGAATHPAWYANVTATPRVELLDAGGFVVRLREPGGDGADGLKAVGGAAEEELADLGVEFGVGFGDES